MINAFQRIETTMILFISIIVLILLLTRNTKKSDFNVETYYEEMKQKDSLINTLIEDNSKLYIFKTRDYHLQTLQFAKNDEAFKLLNESLNKQQIKIQELSSFIKLKITSVDSNNTIIKRIVDTIYIDSIQKIIPSDNYEVVDTNANLTLRGSFNVKDLLFKYSYEYSATYDLISYTKKNNFFSTPKTYLNILSDDINSNIKLNTTYVKQPKPKMQLGIGLGYGLSYNKRLYFSPQINFGIYKSILNIY